MNKRMIVYLIFLNSLVAGWNLSASIYTDNVLALALGLASLTWVLITLVNFKKYIGD